MTETVSKPRIEYIDIAKGILIICLLYGHIRVYAPMDGISDRAMDLMSYPSVFYSAFFMQAFFIITGFCSSFKKDFQNFLWKNVKTLLLPSLLLFLFSEFFKLIVFGHTISIEPFYKLSLWVTTGAPWFIMAMFLGRLVYWPIYRLSLEWQIILLLLLYFIGLYTNLYTSITNFLWFQHTLLLVPYLFIGNQIKACNLLDRKKLLNYFAVFFVVSIAIQILLSHWLGGGIIPSQDHSVCIKIWNFPIHMINSITGTACVIWISKCISHNRFLSTLGTGTLVIYLWNGIIYRSLLRMFIPFYNVDNLLYCLCFHIVTLILCLITFYFIIVLIYNHKTLKWIVGKW